MYTKRYLRIAEAIAQSGVTRRELMRIAHTQGQTLVRKMNPDLKNSPLVVDMERLSAYMDAQARQTYAATARRSV